jgi:ubiquinone/menaquinone biosynthesis C-methylase UbiE
MRVLDDSQVEHFDTEYVTDDVWSRLVPVIRGSFPDGRFSFVDIGGGNGKFADRMLAEFPECSGTVLDTSELLLDRNLPHPRKTLVCDGAENVERIGASFDIACLHWVLHHLVGDTYRESRANIVAQLQATRRVLSDRGRISLFENL